MKSTEYWKKFGSEQVFLWNDEAECFVRSVPGKGFFARYPGRAEFKIGSDSDTVTLAVAAGHEVTKEKYFDDA